ncbi:MAG: 50S ribosomal protein L15 [Deltaproteobacteria bacterium]|nr:50S ribosomal protein L15 [Deltaproteobacteria bacterium]
MRLNELKPSVGARKARKRLGRGDASGHGGTSTKGHKGQKSRSGGYHKVGFEGGQMPLHRRMPKRGFNNTVFARTVGVVNLDQLATWPQGVPVTLEALKERGLIRRRYDGIKLLARGDCKAPLTIRLSWISAAARQKIEAAGGQIESLATSG